MPAARDDSARRSLVPEAAGRSLWLAAVWTGVGAAVVCATLAIVAVAICWLPVSGASAHPISAIRAGLLTFIASVHGGVVIDGTSAQFLPLGLTLVVALMAWRAGAGLGDAATSLDETDSVRLCAAGLAQAASFAAVALVALPFAHLGTSTAPFLGVAGASFVLFVASGGVAFVRTCALGDLISERVPAWVGPAFRAAAAGLALYLAAAALLVAGSLLAHAGRVEALSREIGGGWGGVPILLLGLLAAPNALIASVSYLAGPGFTVGAGASVNAVATTHGVVPAFPLLGALPQAHGASPVVWCLIAVTPIAGGAAVARLAARDGSWGARFGVVGAAAGIAALAMFVLAWQGGGSVGDGRLRTVGASAWQAALMVGAELGVVASFALAIAAAMSWVRRHHRAGPDVPSLVPVSAARSGGADVDERRGTGDLPRAGSRPISVTDATLRADPGEPGELAG